MNDLTFKREICNYFKVDNILTFGRASLGIYIALKAWGKIGKVALPSCICHDVVAAVLLSGNEPLFCDVEIETGVPGICDWEKAFKDGAHAAIVVHLFGNSSQVTKVKRLFGNGLVIDDAAQALGAITDYGFAGEAGDVGIYSFGYSKQINVGGGLLTFKDKEFKNECERLLKLTNFLKQDHIDDLNEKFRLQFYMAKNRHLNDENSNFFIGLLENYKNCLMIEWDRKWQEPIITKLKEYKESIEFRRLKVNAWLKTISNTPLVAVGMKETSVPWRFACRFPNINWSEQNRISEDLRKNGLDVSNWYLPGYYFVTKIKLEKAERFSQEVFQFWIDGTISVEQITKLKLHNYFN